MPLARIFTRNAERTVDLSRQLQQQGYKVEVVSPDQSHLAPADLEIEFEMCERADVLERAADLATELEADIAVAPGVLQSAPEAIVELKAQSPIQPIAAQPVVAQPVTVQPAADSVLEIAPRKELPSDQEREFEAAFSFASAPDMRNLPEVIEIPVMEQAPLPPVAFLEDSPQVEPALEPVRIMEKPSVAVPVHLSGPVGEPANSADPAQYLAHLTPFSSLPPRPETQPASAETDSANSGHDRYKQILQDGTKMAARTWAGVLAITSSTTASLGDHFREYKKRAQIRATEARAAHTARLLDLEQRRAEAHQRAMELEAARVAASARLEELLQQRSPGLPVEHIPSEPEHGLWQPSTYAHTVPKPTAPKYTVPQEDINRKVPPAVAASTRQTPPAPPVAKPARTALKVTPIALWQKVNPPLRAVLTGGAAVSALFIMGIALAIFHSRAPLASPANHDSNGVTVQSDGVILQSSAPAQPAAKPQPAAQPATQATMQAPAKPSPRQRSQQLVAEQSESNIGDDVVIRHFARPVPTQKPKQSGQQAGLKHFSDLDN